jgi:toxin ParE1/3/4
MPRIIRSPRARQDLIDIWTWIAADNPRAADRLLDLIDEKLRLLADNPRLGPARPDIAPDLRLFPLRRYLILYRERADGVEVVRIIHGMRRLAGIV